LKTDKTVKRKGEILIFPSSASDRKYFLRNIPRTTDGVQRFHYQGFMKSIAGKLFVTYGSYWEWQNYRILHQNSGDEILVTYKPQISPNGKYLIAANNVGLYSLSGTNIELWEISENGFSLVWEFISPYYVPEKFAWMSDKEVLFSAVKNFGGEGQSSWQYTFGKINFE
jgi:hypothetical protein